MITYSHAMINAVQNPIQEESIQMLVVIEGLMGIGKSTLQEMLCDHLNGQILVQEFESHPYLHLIYDNPTAYGLEIEMIFMFMGYHQLSNLDHEGKLVVADFTFNTLKVFASVALLESDYDNLYVPCHEYLTNIIPRPDLIIRVVGSPKTALARIKKRRREFESDITIGYLEKLQAAYDRMFQDKNIAPTIIVDTEKHDLVVSPEPIKRILHEMENALPEISHYRI